MGGGDAALEVVLYFFGGGGGDLRGDAALLEFGEELGLAFFFGAGGDDAKGVDALIVHETQGGEAVEPDVGGFFEELIFASGFQELEDDGFFFLPGAEVGVVVVEDVVQAGGDLGAEFCSCGLGEFFQGGVIHGDSLE
ncbi:MAG: hypothetical protein DRZ90_09710 [Spirochaetes bacterium]|nr:MAG: hypothetical protein DRZ90_09710 [Spirochaetota bacterium]